MNLGNLYPKYNCPTCEDWFHMPFKYCKCNKKELDNNIFIRIFKQIKIH